jgi:cell division protein FtsW (lipid II flippase)
VRSWQRRAGYFFLAVAAVVVYQSIWVLRLREGGQPGSGFMPFGLGVLLAALAVALIVANRGADAERAPFWERGAWVQPLLAVAITVVFVVVFEDLGAITSVLVLVTAWLRLVGRKPLRVALLTGVVTAAVVHVVFERLLKTPFPRGLLL